LASSIARKELRIYYFKRDITPQIGVKRLISDSHGTPSQFPWAPIGMTQHLEVLELLAFRHRQQH
jgi:hypothetical protein